MHSSERFLALLHKYTSGQIGPEEQDELFLLISSGNYDRLLENDFSAQFLDNDLQGAGMDPQKARRIIQQVLHAERHTARILPGIFRKKLLHRWLAAAAVLGIILTTGYFFRGRYHQQRATGVENKFFTASFIRKDNLSNHPLKLRLEDSSLIVLEAGAVIHFPPHFSSASREIYLEGDAFFDIAKDADKPFFVYNKHLVTHVLGTSFYIRTDHTKRQLEISVVSGKVQVYEDKDRSTAAGGKKSNGLILLPNHKVIYREEDSQLTEALVSNPVPIVEPSAGQAAKLESFVFEDAPLRQVLPAIEKAYGIEIVMERESLYSCLFTGDISQQSLYAKLDLICQSVKASYEIAGTKILIKGKGCN